MFDLRMPIGSFFLILAVLLVGYGFVSPHPVPFGEQQVNLNLVWGVVMGIFGILMVLLAVADTGADKGA